MKIPLGGKKGKGKFILIDKIDFKRVSLLNWCLASHGYACARVPRSANKIMRIQRFILNPNSFQEVDHINGNILDNRRNNLRIVSHKQNMQNRKKVSGLSSQYKGVCWHKQRNKWTVHIKSEKILRHLGLFKNEHHGALMYDLWAVDLFGKYAKTNFKVIAHSSLLLD